MYLVVSPAAQFRSRPLVSWILFQGFLGRILTLPAKGVCYIHRVRNSIVWNRVKWVAMDITDFHEHMREKYAEKRKRDRELWGWIAGLLVFFSLVFCVVLGYAVR
jgi:hypothetical protein